MGGEKDGEERLKGEKEWGGRWGCQGRGMSISSAACYMPSFPT